MLIEDGAAVLFQGDSVTDAGRRRNGRDMGGGYAARVAATFAQRYPAKNVRFYNRGISGNRVRDLRARWQNDCLALRPSWVSILIGINDMWRRYDSNDLTTPERFEDDYRALLTPLCTAPGTRLILCEPFFVAVRPEMTAWRADLDPKIAIVRKLAQESGALLLPLNTIFTDAARQHPPQSLAADGIHPTEFGHSLIADAWLNIVA